jgi:hypothetical protein
MSSLPVSPPVARLALISPASVIDRSLMPVRPSCRSRRWLRDPASTEPFVLAPAASGASIIRSVRRSPIGPKRRLPVIVAPPDPGTAVLVR